MNNNSNKLDEANRLIKLLKRGGWNWDKGVINTLKQIIYVCVCESSNNFELLSVMEPII